MHLHLYADDESIDTLGAGRSKAILIGSDFGYGNFGDLLQHKGAAAHIKASSELAVVSILALDAISRHADVAALRAGYGVDALGFVSERPIAPEMAAKLRLREVAILSNVAYVQLYGGGFLNEMWGDFVLGVAEYFLERLPGAVYVISGQQISPAYAPRVRDHVAKFRPHLVGVRDRVSAGLMAELDMQAEISFDDAVEPLLGLRHMLDLREGEGAFVHLNTSGYTSNSGALDEMIDHLHLVADRMGGSRKPILFQAFQDAREEVMDSIETVKRLESGFPFVDVETVMLVAAVMRGERLAGKRTLAGRFGYSSSYHVALWLQLSGIPCWLRGSNEYYRQKRKALGIDGKFEDFLERMHCPDHAENLHERSQWMGRLKNVLGNTGPVNNRVAWEIIDPVAPVRIFNFKGEPWMEERLSQAWQAAEGNRQENERLKTQLDEAESHVQACNRQLEEAESHVQACNRQLEEAESREQAYGRQLEEAESREQAYGRQLEEAESREQAYGRQLEEAESREQAYSAQLEEAESRMQACNRQLSEIGTDARYFRDQCLSMQSSLQQAAANAEQLRQITGSRSWRLTRPLRVANRFIATRRFDPAGEIGIYEMLRIIGKKLPIKARWRSAAGRVLRRFRRR